MTFASTTAGPTVIKIGVLSSSTSSHHVLGELVLLQAVQAEGDNEDVARRRGEDVDLTNYGLHHRLLGAQARSRALTLPVFEARMSIFAGNGLHSHHP